MKELLICCSCRALAAAVAVVPAAAARAEDASGVASSRMSYSRFLEYLDMGRVKKVQLLVHFSACTFGVLGAFLWSELKTVLYIRWISMRMEPLLLWRR